MLDFLIKFAEIIIGKVAENWSKIKEWWKNTKIFKFLNRYSAYREIKLNQKTFNTFILLNISNIDQIKTKNQKAMFSIQHPLHKAVVSEMELWRAIKASTISPEERAPINELLSVSGTTADFSKRYLKKVGKKRLKYCKDYIEILKKYQKYQIDNYKPIRLQCIINYTEATKKYYELLYSYLPIDKRNIIEKAFDK